MSTVNSEVPESYGEQKSKSSENDVKQCYHSWIPLTTSLKTTKTRDDILNIEKTVGAIRVASQGQ